MTVFPVLSADSCAVSSCVCSCSLETISNLEIASSGVEDRFAFAHKIALDLFQYMASFNGSNPGQPGAMVVPTTVFDSWLERFERKYKLDPNFMLKS